MICQKNLWMELVEFEKWMNHCLTALGGRLSELTNLYGCSLVGPMWSIFRHYFIVVCLDHLIVKWTSRQLGEKFQLDSVWMKMKVSINENTKCLVKYQNEFSSYHCVAFMTSSNPPLCAILLNNRALSIPCSGLPTIFPIGFVLKFRITKSSPSFTRSSGSISRWQSFLLQPEGVPALADLLTFLTSFCFILILTCIWLFGSFHSKRPGRGSR